VPSSYLLAVCLLEEILVAQLLGLVLVRDLRHPDVGVIEIWCLRRHAGPTRGRSRWAIGASENVDLGSYEMTVELMTANGPLPASIEIAVREPPLEKDDGPAEDDLATGPDVRWITKADWETFEMGPRTTSTGRGRAQFDQQSASLVVEHDHADLHYDGRFYRAVMRRRLRNASEQPVSRYLIRISVDRYPGNPERSNQLYREDPLTWHELDLHAECRAEPMRWKVQHDRDSFKEVWLLFENDAGHFPLYPGESTTIEYAYTVSDNKWGHWFQRAIRLPTERLSVRLLFPTELEPVVWGMETTMSADAHPFPAAIHRYPEDGRDVFTWSTENAPLHARYRLEWRFKARDRADQDSEPSPTATMTALGVVQEGDPILARPTRPFDLPTEAEDARRVVAELQSSIERISEVHNFGKGIGIAAPQIGIDRSAALIRLPSGDTVTFLNPKVIEETDDVDDQYEGCLSFFDVRGMVPRPLAIHVEHQDVNGDTHITHFDRGAARLICHEIDHLNGMLYKARMREGVRPIPVTEYRGGGQQWEYPHPTSQ
jgi:peptide deformylase